MINSSIANYSFEDSNKLFGNNHRINITMHSGKVYNIAVEENAGNFILPKCIRNLFWAKVKLSDTKTILVNRSSLAKRTGTSRSLSNFALLQHKESFESAIKLLHKAAKMTDLLKNSRDSKSDRIKKVSNLVKTIEEKQEKYRQRAAVSGGFVKQHKDYALAVRIDPKDSTKANFYIKHAKSIARGGYKKVYTLMDYDTGKFEYAMSIQKMDPNRPHKIDFPRKGFEIMNAVKDSKLIMKAELFYEKGIKRDSAGALVMTNKNASSYLITKLYHGRFKDLICQNDISFTDKLVLFSKILKGVMDLHAQGIVHQDLKGANVLYKHKNDQIKIKIIDFDLSQSFKDRIKTQEFAGTLNYIAPEALARSVIQYPEKLDSWSIGIMLYILCEGTPYFFKELDKASQNNWSRIVLNGTRNLPFKKLNEADELRGIIKGLLLEDPGKRISVKDALLEIQKITK